MKLTDMDRIKLVKIAGDMVAVAKRSTGDWRIAVLALKTVTYMVEQINRDNPNYPSGGPTEEELAMIDRWAEDIDKKGITDAEQVGGWIEALWGKFDH